MPLWLNKRIGETPLEALGRLRIENPKLEKERLSYAGRLDPLAEGLLLVLIGEECDEERRPTFLGLEKEYEVEVLFGFATDSYDLLGIPVKDSLIKNLDSGNLENLKWSLEKIIPEFIGTGHGLKYPAFSSKTIDGRPLFELAKSKGDLPSSLPDIKGSIKSIKIINSRILNTVDLKDHLHKVIALVSGDFRQNEIISAWDFILGSVPKEAVWPIFKLSVACEPGVYMRSLAESLGKKLGFGGLAFSIKRTKIGEHSL